MARTDWYTSTPDQARDWERYNGDPGYDEAPTRAEAEADDLPWFPAPKTVITPCEPECGPDCPNGELICALQRSYEKRVDVGDYDVVAPF